MFQDSDTAAQTDRITQALQKVQADGQNLTNGDPSARANLVASARKLLTAAETPVESLLWQVWALPTRTVAARTAIETTGALEEAERFITADVSSAISLLQDTPMTEEGRTALIRLTRLSTQRDR